MTNPFNKAKKKTYYVRETGEFFSVKTDEPIQENLVIFDSSKNQSEEEQHETTDNQIS